MNKAVRFISGVAIVTALATVLPAGSPAAWALVEEDRIVYTWGCDEPPGFMDLDLLDPSDSSVTFTETIMDEGASISPDGSRIAAAASDGIVVTDPDGTGGEMLAGTAGARFPVWSPDGTEIAFSRGTQLFVVGYDPYAVPAAITPQVSSVMSALDWSPDGTTLLWSRISGGADHVIETVAIGDGTRTEIGTGSDAHFSSDGSWIAYTSRESAPQIPFRIAKMDSDGSNVVITDEPGVVGAVLGDEVAIAQQLTVNGATEDYIGIYSFVSDTTVHVLQGPPLCDTNFYIWDWGVLELPTFRDTSYADLFFADIEWLGDQGITKGCNPPVNDEFCPKGILTRGEIAAFLVRALGLSEGDPDVFVDDDNSVFEHDIDRLAAAGITKGCNPPINDRFCPDEYVTRGQIAAFLVRAFGYVDDGGGNLFVDDDNSVFEHDIDRLAAAGVTKGCNPPTNDMYCPANLINREQFAAMLHRALG